MGRPRRLKRGAKSRAKLTCSRTSTRERAAQEAPKIAIDLSGITLRWTSRAEVATRVLDQLESDHY
jgi:hypothetical protein